MTCPKQIVSPCIGDDINHFVGILPSHHNEAGCHRETTKRKKIFCEMKKLLDKMDTIPTCQEWDTTQTTNNTKGPHRVGIYDQRHGKPWDLDRVPSRELIGGVLVPVCLCSKKNGLQDDCPRSQCKGKPWCLSEPWPDCPPFTRVKKEWVDEDPLIMCPNYPKPQFTGIQDLRNPRISGDKFKMGCRGKGLYSFSQVPNNDLPESAQGGGPIYQMDDPR